MKTLELLNRLRNAPIFTVRDLEKMAGMKPAYARILASRLARRGLVTRIERSKYTIMDDPLVVAAYLARPSYVGLLSALRFHGMTEQITSAIDIMVPKARKETEVLGKKVFFTKTKHFWGFEKYRLNGIDILVSDPEKTIMDCIISEKMGADTVLEAVKSRELDGNKLLGYVSRTGNRALGKRIGYLLGKAGKKSADFRIFAKGSYAALDPRMPKKGHRDRNWRIIENAVVE